jgi:hypothetical protein
MTLRRSQPRARRRWAVLFISIVMLTTAFGGAVLAVHDDNVFELDRNALDGAGGGEDWQNIDEGTDTAGSSTGIVVDPTNATIFTTGGSKDDLNTTSWKHKAGSSPDKDELQHAFAARYGDVVYFGADRIDASGAAALGFWFFQEEVAPQAGGTFGPGQHKDGDILILSDFSVGGGTVTIRVFEWNGPGGDIPGQGTVNGVLDLLAGTNDPDVGVVADCVGPPAVGEPDPFCATVNNGNQTSPWPFDPKSGADNVFKAGEFYEGGIDLAAFPGLSEVCFTSFLAETRTSPSVGSQLKDFVGGNFEDCVATVTTTPSDANGDPLPSITLGDSIHDYALIEGEGADDAPTGTMEFFICSPAQLTGGVCATGGTEVNGDGVGALNGPVTVTRIGTTANSEALSSSFEPTSVGTWCWRGEYSGDSLYPPASDSSSGECFTVTDYAITSTAQKWLPNDTATVVSQGGSVIAGTVTFELFESANCSGTAVQTFADQPVNSSGVAVSDNETYYTIATTISWKATFTSSDSAVGSGDPSHCETMTVSTLDNDITTP